MPILNLNDLPEVKTITYYQKILDEFNDKIKIEEEKYPLTDREQIFVQTIRELLDTLDISRRRW
jgi:hypothetical protein